MSEDPTKNAAFLQKLIAKQQDNHFRMEWEGLKIPRGATIGGIGIDWAQHGLITGENGESLGFYRREDMPGKHMMLIATKYEEVTPPPGGTVEKIPQEKYLGF